MFDRGQAASVRRASSLIITPSPPLRSSAQMGMKKLVDASNKIFNAAVGTPEEASSDIACFLYGRCHRKAISATVKLLMRLQPLPLAFPSLFNTQYLCRKTSIKLSVERVLIPITMVYNYILSGFGAI